MKHDLATPYALGLIALTALLALAAAMSAGLAPVQKVDMSDALAWLRAR